LDLPSAEGGAVVGEGELPVRHGDEFRPSQQAGRGPRFRPSQQAGRGPRFRPSQQAGRGPR
jgi:hypothetical protein